MIGFVFDDQMFGVASPEQMFDGLILNAVLEMRWAEWVVEKDPNKQGLH